MPLFHLQVTELHDDDSPVDFHLVADTSDDEECVVDVDCMNDVFVNAAIADTDIDNEVDNDDDSGSNSEQQNDVSLAGCHNLAAAGKGNFAYRTGVLYRGDHVLGQQVWQLVVPQCRHEQRYRSNISSNSRR